MRTRALLLAPFALLAVLLIGGCGTGAMPTPSSTVSSGPGAGEAVALKDIQIIRVHIDIETRACNVFHEDCEDPLYVTVDVPCEIEGDPVTVPFRDGTLTVETVGFFLDPDDEPRDIHLAFSVIANGTQDFYGSYVNDEGGRDFYNLDVDPYLFTYDQGWRVQWPFVNPNAPLAVREVEQWGGNGRYSFITIELYDNTPGR